MIWRIIAVVAFMALGVVLIVALGLLLVALGRGRTPVDSTVEPVTDGSTAF